MRFVLAIVLFVVAFVSIGLGVAQRTIFQGPDHLTAAVQVTGGAPFTVIDGSVLGAHPGTQTLTVAGTGTVLIAYGRTDDVVAWVGDAPVAELSYAAETGELTSTWEPGGEADVPSPAGSDLWIQEFSGEDVLVRKINVPADVSVIVAADGTAMAPEISITWPLDNTTPWSGTLILAGIGALLLGLGALIWALVHARRRHGPRRKTPRMPKPPKPAQLKPAQRRPAITVGRGRRGFVVVPIAVAALALSACTPSGGAVPEPVPSGSEAPVDQPDPPVITERQFDRIIDRVNEAVSDADAGLDATLAAVRLAGPALELRTANYTARTTDSAIAAVPAFPSGEVSLVLPQQRRDWPRVVFAAAKGADGAEYGLMLVQELPREQYQVHYLMRLTQSIPEVAPVELGAARLAPDNRLLAYTPEQLAIEYGDLLINGDASEFAEHFDPENDLLRENFGAAYKEQRRSEQTNAVIEFTTAPGQELPFAFATNDTGAIVAVDLREIETVKPAETGAAVSPRGAVKALSGTVTTTKGITAEYGMQVLFYVPPVTAEDQRVRVLGFTQGLVAASEVP